MADHDVSSKQRRRMASARCLAGLALSAVLSTAAQAGPEVCVSAELRFGELKPEPDFVRVLQREVSSIWKRYGVRVAWNTDASGCQPVEGSFDIMIVRTLQTTWKSGQAVLASSHIPASAIDHVPVLVDYDATERHVWSLSDEQLKARVGLPQPRSIVLGRAIGRLVAHEIGHVLLAAPGHQRRGLMRPSFAPADLVSWQRGAFTLSRAEQLQLRCRAQRRLRRERSSQRRNGVNGDETEKRGNGENGEEQI
jgi:hypothetical protein